MFHHECDTPQARLWQRLDPPGHDWVLCCQRRTHWYLNGTAIFVDGYLPYRLDYHVVCDAAWHTVSATVTGWAGSDPIQVELAVHPHDQWFLNGSEAPQVAGCLDVDLSFSPATNTLPIRRLNLAIGEEATVHAAWLRVPSFTLERLVQVYRRTDTHTYHYEAVETGFTTTLHIDAEGFIACYPDLWQVEASS